MAAALEIVRLSKTYGGPPLFTDLSFTVTRGLVAVSGRNGSGKTTLLKILAGLGHPSGGTVRVLSEGRELTGDARRLAVGWTGPDLAFYEDFTAGENLAFFRRAAGRPAPENELTRRLEDVGLAEAALSKRVGEFSTGMRQRLRLAFACLFDPEILLLDEPTLGLDAEGHGSAAQVVAAQRARGIVIVASNDDRDFVKPDQTVALGRT